MVQCSISPPVVKLPEEVLCFRPEEMYMISWLVWHLLTSAVREVVTKHNPHNEVWLPSNEFPVLLQPFLTWNKKVTKPHSNNNKKKRYQPPVASNAVKEQTGSRPGWLLLTAAVSRPHKQGSFSSLVPWQLAAAAFRPIPPSEHFSALKQQHWGARNSRACRTQDYDTAKKKVPVP